MRLRHLQNLGLLRAYKLSTVIAVALGIIAIAVSWGTTINSENSLVNYHRKQAEQLTELVKLKVEQEIKEKEWLTQVFFVNNRPALERLIENPNDEETFTEIDTKLGRYFIDFHTFNLVSSDGELVVDNFEGKLGEICSTDLRHFHKTDTKRLRLHPNNIRYHYDIPHKITHMGANYVVFVSFDFGLMSSILRDIQVEDHNLLLVDRSQDYLIEATALGSRRILHRDDFHLDSAERNRILSAAPITDTSWYAVDMIREGLFEEEMTLTRLNGLTILAASTLLILIIWQALKRHEARLQLINTRLANQNRAITDENKTLKQYSITDELTGLYNRRYFNEVSEMRWGNAVRNGQSLCLVIIDVDYFKNYNDTYGHPEGDQCLKTISNAMANTYARSVDVVARYGGEEFAILTTDSSYKESEALAHKLLETIESLKIKHSGSEVSNYVTISIGVVHIVPTREMSLHHLIVRADNALYEAKKSGRNRVVAYDYTNHEHIKTSDGSPASSNAEY